MMNCEPLLAELKPIFGDRVRCNEPLAEHTTLRVGGPAEVWLAVESAEELIAAATVAQRHALPVLMLGSGANLLVAEAGVRGLVIENRANRVKFPDRAETPLSPGEGATITVESGAAMPSLARRCARRGLSGLEWAVGLPGTVGGAVVNNAGAYDGDMAQTLLRAELLSPDGERVWQPGAWFEYGYRASRLKRQKEGWLVLQAELQVVAAPPEEIEARMNAYNERRKESQPPGATIGSMFKNPPGDYAGRLIEAVGLKGYRVGQAQISTVHANFFQNLGGATATDMLTLIETAHRRVQAKFGIDLELEIEIVGEVQVQ
jgi:UDP-N-acetylmuramate dehydrogenase